MDDQMLSNGEFTLGNPALVCRWRLAGGTLPLANRHLRALSKRIVNGRIMPVELVAWAKQHIEQTLARGSSEHPDGVLMLVMDQAGHAAMTVGPYQPLGRTTLRALLRRAETSYQEAEVTGVAPETLWASRTDALLWDIDRDFDTAGSASLIEDLAHTMGLRVERRPGLRHEVERGEWGYDEAFLVSDEHGVVPTSDRPSARGTRFAQSYERLLERERAKALGRR